MINEQFTRHWSNGVEDLRHYDPNGVIDWERGVDTTTPKAASISMKPTRVVGDYFTTEMVLPHLKAYGATPVKHKQPKLWSQYVPCEYIENSGTQYIKTGVVAKDIDEAELTLARMSDATSQYYLGTRSGETAIGYAIYFTAHGGVYYYPLAWNGNGRSVEQNVKFTTKTEFKNGTDNFYYNGTLINTHSYAQSKYDTGDELYLGAIRESDGRAAYVCSAKFYRVVLRKNGVLVRDFVPVKDVVNNVYGMFDRVTEKFYGNAGTGAFTGGELIQPIAGVTNGSNSNVDTGLYADDNMEMFIRFKAITGSFYIFQARQTGTARIYGISGAQADNTITAYLITSSISRTAGHIYTVKLTVINRAVTLYVKDETAGTEDTKTGTAESGTYSFPSPTTIKLFGDADKVASGVTVYDAYIKTNGEYVWEFLPVRIGTSQVELLDLVNWQFATRTGTFTAGADTQLVPDIIKVNTGDLKYGQYGKNLFSSSLNMCTWAQIVGEVATKITSTIRVGCNDFISVKPNTTYTLKMMGTQTFSEGSWRLMLCDKNDVIKTKVPVPQTTHYITFTTGADEVKFCFFIAEDKTSLDGWDWMLVEGSIAPTEYEPYKFGIFTDGSHKLHIEDENGNVIERDIPTLYSAQSYVDTQLDSNNKSEAWAAIWYDGTQTVPSGYISQTGDLTPNQIVLYPLATPAVSTHAIAKVDLTEKETYTVVSESELPVTQQAVYMGLGL